MLTAGEKALYFARPAASSQAAQGIEGKQVSKIRKQSREKYDSSELFSDEEFDAEDFVDQMDNKTSKHRTEAHSGWRRIEELREEQMLRDQLSDLDGWDDFDKD
jgi:hypothetical protein